MFLFIINIECVSSRYMCAEKAVCITGLHVVGVYEIWKVCTCVLSVCMYAVMWGLYVCTECICVWMDGVQ